MKVLVISVLRLGDIVMTTPALRALKAKGHEVHLLINKQFEAVIPLLSDVDRVHTLDRKSIERALVEPSHGLFEAYDRLEWLLQRLSSENYDLIVNLTHNRLAGLLSAMIPAGDCVGLSISEDDVASFGSPWFRYLNEVGISGAKSGFHISDIFQFALGEEKLRDRYFLKETERGRAEWHQFRRLLGDVILVQPFSSDLKKEWSSDHLLRGILDLEQRIPRATVVLMAAPFEKERLIALMQELRNAGARAQSAVLSLEGALSAIRDASLFVTVDTATKHLAAATSTPVVELALGGSDPRKTGIYRSGQYVLQSQIPCSPCSHVKNCTQPSRLCAESLHPEAVAEICAAVYLKETSRLGIIAAPYKDRWSLFKTHLSPTSAWSLELVNGVSSKFLEQLNRQSWKISLSLKPDEVWQEMGSQVLQFRQTLDELEVGEIDPGTIRNLEQRLQSQLDQVQSLKRDFQKEIRHSPSDKHVQIFIGRLKNLLAECEMADFHKLDNVETRSLTALRRLQMALEDIERKNHIEMKLVRYIPILREESI